MPHDTIDILGVRFARLSPAGALLEIERLHDAERPGFVAHANVHTVNLAYRDPPYRDVLNRADLVLNDGKGVMLGARLLGSRFDSDLNGNFFSPLALQRAATLSWPVFFFGAKPGVAERAAERLEREVGGLKIAGVRDGFFEPGEEPAITDEIRASGASLLFVGLGNPMQERWLDRHLPATGARLGVGVGAFFDFQAGEIERAPEKLNRAGLEWAYRLAKEPKRMWRRYLLGNPLFVLRVLKSRLGGRIPS